jgi:hypothetical protein
LKFYQVVAAGLALAFLGAPAFAQWNDTLISRNQTNVGAAGTVDCPGGGAGGAIWGTGMYTSDSSICMSAVHYGWISQAAGGRVSYQAVPGMASYQASANNGVNSLAYGSWSLSLQITGAQALAGGGVNYPTPIGWTESLASLARSGAPGTVMQFVCPPGNTPTAIIWGSDIYTSDSPICVAAQHRGLIAPGGGGLVNVMLLGRQEGFSSTARNGVTSSTYGPWDMSYVFQ